MEAYAKMFVILFCLPALDTDPDKPFHTFWARSLGNVDMVDDADIGENYSKILTLRWIRRRVFFSPQSLGTLFCVEHAAGFFHRYRAFSFSL